MIGKRLMRAGVVVTSGLLLAGCFGGGSSKDSRTDPTAAVDLLPDAGTPQDGGTFTTIDPSDAPSLDPHKAASAYTGGGVSGIVYSKLLDFKVGREIPYGSMEVYGDLAESWKRSDDGKTWTFTLRKGVKFQNIAPVNGREFVAADVLCTVDRIKTLPGVQANLMVVVDSVTAPDPHTVVFNLNAPYAAFDETMANFYMTMLPCEGTRGEFDLATKPIGTGPFIMAQWDRKQQRIYKKNPDYFVKGKPHLDEFKIIIMADPVAQIAAFRTGQVDYFGSITETLLPTLVSTNPDAVVRRQMGMTEGWTFFNQNVKPFDNLKVRQAIQMSLDRDGMARTFSSPGYKLSGPIPPNIFGGLSPEESGKLTPYDPTAAKKLLAEAGYPNGFDVILTTTDGYGPVITNRAQWVQEDLKKIGITATLKVLDYATWFSTWQSKDYQMGYGYSSGLMTADEFLAAYWLSNGTRNWFNINDPKLDAMIMQQRSELDKDKREKLLLDTNRYIINNVANPVASYTNATIVVQQPYVHDLWGHPMYARSWVKDLWLGPEAPGRK
jgi:peptide/nickel transport system substrate-binding protein